MLHIHLKELYFGAVLSQARFGESSQEEKERADLGRALFWSRQTDEGPCFGEGGRLIKGLVLEGGRLLKGLISGVSLRATYQANWLAVRMILPPLA